MNHKRASYLKRFTAFIIDWYFSTLFACIPVIIMQSIQARDLSIVNRLDNLNLSYAWIGGILALVLYTVYYCIIPCKEGTNRKIGQTLGRFIMKIQLTTIDSSPLTFKKLFIRDFLCVLILQGYLTSSNIYIMSLVQMTTKLYVVPYFQSFYYVVIAISLLMLFAGKKKQMLHDLLSKTQMIEVTQ